MTINGDEVPRPNQLLPNQKPTSDLIDVVLDGRLWYYWSNLFYDCSNQRSLTRLGKTGNRYVILRQEMELSFTW